MSVNKIIKTAPITYINILLNSLVVLLSNIVLVPRFSWLECFVNEPRWMLKVI